MLGVATLEMTLGNRDGPRRKELVDFVVLPVSAGYNALMGLPFICRFGAVIFVPHFCLRFPVGDQVSSHHGDVKQSHTCQVSTDTGIARPAAPVHQPRIASLIECYSFVGALTSERAAVQTRSGQDNPHAIGARLPKCARRTRGGRHSRIPDPWGVTLLQRRSP